MHIDATSRIYQHYGWYQNLHINQYIQIYHLWDYRRYSDYDQDFLRKRENKKKPQNGNNIYININNSVAGTLSN